MPDAILASVRGTEAVSGSGNRPDCPGPLPPVRYFNRPCGPGEIFGTQPPPSPFTSFIGMFPRKLRGRVKNF